MTIRDHPYKFTIHYSQILDFKLKNTIKIYLTSSVQLFLETTLKV